MNVEQVKELMAEMNRQGITELSWNGEGVELSLSRLAGQTGAVATAGPAAPAVAAPAGLTDETADSTVGEERPAGEGDLITSPVVGVFYAAASPDHEPYVEVGKSVKKGDVLCIIEAMKLMNEVVCEKDGEVTEILVSDGEKVEYGQALLRIK